MAEKQYNERFEKWLDQVNRACGRFSGAALESGFHGSLSEHLAHAIKLAIALLHHRFPLQLKNGIEPGVIALPG